MTMRFSKSAQNHRPVRLLSAQSRKLESKAKSPSLMDFARTLPSFAMCSNKQPEKADQGKVIYQVKRLKTQVIGLRLKNWLLQNGEKQPKQRRQNLQRKSMPARLASFSPQLIQERFNVQFIIQNKKLREELQRLRVAYHQICSKTVQFPTREDPKQTKHREVNSLLKTIKSQEIQMIALRNDFFQKRDNKGEDSRSLYNFYLERLSLQLQSQRLALLSHLDISHLLNAIDPLQEKSNIRFSNNIYQLHHDLGELVSQNIRMRRQVEQSAKLQKDLLEALDFKQRQVAALAEQLQKCYSLIDGYNDYKERRDQLEEQIRQLSLRKKQLDKFIEAHQQDSFIPLDHKRQVGRTLKHGTEDSLLIQRRLMACAQTALNEIQSVLAPTQQSKFNPLVLFKQKLQYTKHVYKFIIKQSCAFEHSLKQEKHSLKRQLAASSATVSRLQFKLDEVLRRIQKLIISLGASKRDQGEQTKDLRMQLQQLGNLVKNRRDESEQER